MALGTLLFRHNHAFLCQFQCWLFLIFLRFCLHTLQFALNEPEDQKDIKRGLQFCSGSMWGIGSSHGWTSTKVFRTCGQLATLRSHILISLIMFELLPLVIGLYVPRYALVASHYGLVSPPFSVPVSKFLVLRRFCCLHLRHSMNTTHKRCWKNLRKNKVHPPTSLANYPLRKHRLVLDLFILGARLGCIW